jgi:signal peptidase I
MSRVSPVSADPEAPKGHAKKSGSFWRELPILLIIALGLALLIKTFLMQAFYIPSGSMEETLAVGDRVLVNKLAYQFTDIQRGDVIVFNGVDSWAPEAQVAEPTNPVKRAVRSIAGAFGFATPSEKDYIKRVIGVPGDHVVCCDKQDRITVNGVALNEDYLFPGDSPSDQDFDITVPDGRLWVMGDHRGMSSDSRSHLADPGGGAIPVDRVIGRAFVIIWPFSDAGLLTRPDTFDNAAIDAARESDKSQLEKSQISP